jgi:hypothetical protein
MGIVVAANFRSGVFCTTVEKGSGIGLVYVREVCVDFVDPMTALYLRGPVFVHCQVVCAQPRLLPLP